MPTHAHTHTHTHISANSSAQSGRYKKAKMHRMPSIAYLFPQKSHHCRTLLQTIIYKDRASYPSSPPRTIHLPYLYRLFSAKVSYNNGSFAERDIQFKASYASLPPYTIYMPRTVYQFPLYTHFLYIMWIHLYYGYTGVYIALYYWCDDGSFAERGVMMSGIHRRRRSELIYSPGHLIYSPGHIYRVGWQRCMRCLKLYVSFRKRAIIVGLWIPLIRRRRSDINTTENISISFSYIMWMQLHYGYILIYV